MSAPDYNRVFTEAFDAELADIRVGYPGVEIATAGRATKDRPNGEDEKWWRSEGAKMVHRWHEWRQSSTWDIWVTPDGEPAIELGIELDFDGREFKLIIDRVFNSAPSGGPPRLIVVDLKTGSRTPDSVLQLGCYGAALEMRYGIRPTGGAYWMARDGKMSPVFSLHRYTPALIGHYCKQMTAAEDNRIYLPHISARCRACGVNKYCAAYGGEQAYRDPDYALTRRT